MQDRSQTETSLSQLPSDLLKVIIGLLDPRDFRLSRINKLIHRLFHEPWYDQHWEKVTQQVWRSMAGNKAKYSWARRYLFLDESHHSRNDIQSRLRRLVRTSDQVSARMLDFHHDDIGNRSDMLIESHVNKLKSLLRVVLTCESWCDSLSRRLQ
jgi:hypothetical protein